MKNKISILVTLSILIFNTNIISQKERDNYVESYTVNFENENFNIIELSREGERVNAKYFASEMHGNKVPDRYKEFDRSKNVILYTAGTYMDGNRQSVNVKPVGLTIDNGEVVNGTLSGLDGLVIVYATGGIAVSNIEKGDLSLGGISHKIDLNIGWHYEEFIDWAKSNRATVFQTHLLVHDNELNFKLNKQQYANTKQGRATRERRFLAICISDDGDGVAKHIIVQKNHPENLYNASEKVLNFLKYRLGYKVYGLLNLDTGYQDVFQYFDSSGKEDPIIVGPVPLSTARNLLVYYFE
jgi:hypothetical protein